MRLGLCLLFGLFQTGSADFNQAFATSVLSDIESLVSEPWDRVLNIAYATFNSGGSYLYETRLQDIPTNVNNTQEFVWSLWAPVVGFLDWVYVGFYDGSFYAYSGGTYLYQQNRNNTLYTYWNTTSTIDGKPTGPPSSTSNTYDCTVRPWYTQSEDEGSIWTAPYAFVVGGGGIGITAALRVENKYGEFLGIFAIDYLISNLETILADKVATATNYFLIYIIDNDGLMIAASISGVTSEGTNRIRANESSSDLIRLSAIEIEKYGGNFSAADGILLSIDVPNDGVYFVQASELSEEHGLHWHIIVTELVSCESNNYIPREFDDVLVDTDDTCKECPDNLQCDGEDIYPYPGEGYWMDRDYSKIPKAVYPCVRDTCLGFKQKMKIIYENKKKNNNDDDFTAENYESFADFYDDMIDICWKRGSIDTNDTRCDSDYLMCEKGSQGPLCGTCMDSYTYNSATRKCISCTGNQSVVPAIIIGAILGLIILAIILFVLKDSKLVGGLGLVETEAQTRALVQKFLSIPPFSILKQVDQGMIKVIWATSQIIGTISWNLSIRYPEPFDSLLKVLAYLQLNFFALDCQDSSANFTSRVLFNSFGPLVLSAAIVIGYFIRVALLNNSAKKALDGKDEEKDKEVMESEKQRLMEQHLYFFLLLGFIVLPTVSMLQFTALECTDLADGSSYLRVDTSISCHSSSYKSFLIMDGFLIVIYQSVPLLWFVLLYRIRDKVHPKGAAKHRVVAANRKTVKRRSNVTTTDVNAKITQELLSETEKTEVRGRNGDPSIQYVAFLWKDYRPERWYFEVFEMCKSCLRCTFSILNPPPPPAPHCF
jgi:hypothetical protein